MVVPSDAASTPSDADIDAITSRRFSNSFRGWDPDEVRVHLVSVAEIVRSLTHRQADLERLLAEAEATARRADLTVLDPDEVSRVLGEETARVLRAAREAATEIEAKATAQAELLARQAADDAARLRADAEAEASQIRRDARETAEATRAAGEAHLADVQAAGEAELVRERGEIEAELAAEREVARDESTSQLAIAQEHAATVRREADDEVARLRADAHDELAAQRGELEAELTDRQASTTAELAALTERAMDQLAEAERMRDRVLADLARKRRAARQHLEQLHAGRDRLLTAYDVIRATTDQATGELDVVLGDAKRIADDAARRVGAEDLPTPEEMLAELELARSAGLPIIAPPVDIDTGEIDTDGTDTDGINTDGINTDGTDTDGTDTDEARGDASVEPTAESVDPTGVTPTVDEAAAPPAEVEPVTGPDDAAPSESTSPTVTAPIPISSPPTNHRRHARRTAHRRDPLDGGELPDVPMVPVEVSAEFERVRVVSGTALDEPGATAPPAPPDAAADSSASNTPGAPVNDAPAPLAEAPKPMPGATTTHGDAVGGDDAVSGIFARLRAEAEKPAPPEPAQTSEEPAEPADAPKTSRSVGKAEAKTVEQSGVPTEAHPPDEAKVEDTPKPPSKPTSAGTPAAAQKPKTKPSTKSKPSGKESEAAGKSKAGSRPKVAATPGAVDDDELASIFERRDAAVDEVGRRLAKHLKRELSDQQSSLLDELRRHRGVPSVDELLGAPDEFSASWDPVIQTDLLGAVAAGAALAGDLDPAATDHASADVADPTRELIAAIAEPLRARLVRALGEGATDVDDVDTTTAAVDGLELADRIRACYREWRGARLAASVSDACSRAFGLGVRAALPATTGLRWYGGPRDAPCSDCNDNQLAGRVASGGAFPTGQQVAPAHPGCRCLALPAPD